MELKPHEERILAERGELSDRLGKLNAFIDGAGFVALAETDRDLLVRQRSYMTAYLGVLSLRVARFMAG